MNRHTLWLAGLLLVLLAGLPAVAQTGTPATALDTINVRSGPSGDYPVLGQVSINAGVIIEGRNASGDRVLVNTGSVRGWVASRYLAWAAEVPLSAFPVTEEIIGGAPAPAADAAVEAPAAAAEAAALVPAGPGTPARVLSNNLNVRSGAGSTFTVLAQLPLNAGVVIEARNGIGNWALVNTGSVRGWVATRYLAWAQDVLLASFPVSGEVIGGAPAAVAEAAPAQAAAAAPAGAPGGRVIAATLNVRMGAASTQTQLGTLTRGTIVSLEARNSIGDWVLVNANGLRGWVASRFVDFAAGVELAALPVSSEVIGVTAPAAAAEGAAPAAALAPGGDSAALEAQLAGVPVVPGVTARARSIYAAGIRAGRNPQRFTKVGDCNSENVAFMYGFDWNNYSLGSYGYLQSTIDYFAGSFARPSVAGKVGYSAVTVIDALWADPAVCRSGEAPVWCELRTSNASMVVIMFGANDISILTPERYESALRRILDLSLQANVVPVLSTFPTDPAQPDRWLKALQLNVITVNLAREYDLPVMNFWLAAKTLPGAGMAADNAHLTTHSGSSIVFDGTTESTYGFTARNLVVLQTLDALRQGLGG
ncbi:MAG: SH3 domain-containing protein [Anaerolineae bacterium]|nr:SH3 domain-containing protein [Anaerolineae bacterium]